MNIVREAVVSSNIVSMGHDPILLHCDIEFAPNKHGLPNIYRYFGVPVETFEAVKSAESVGTAVRAHIVGKYPCTKKVDVPA